MNLLLLHYTSMVKLVGSAIQFDQFKKEKKHKGFLGGTICTPAF